MRSPSPAIAAAVRAIGGESDLDAVLPALDDWRLARVIACAPDADPVVRAVAALCGRLSDLLDPSIVADPALHIAMARLIGTPAGRAALRSWAEVAPAGWGRAHAAALIDAVQQGVCDPAAAAALIGPGDVSAGLLLGSTDVAFAIRRWGQANPDAPTAWAGALSAGERRRLLTQVRHDPSAIAFCLPWLPPNIARAAGDAIPVRNALDAFAAASPTVRTRRAAILQRLVARAEPGDLNALTRLACATGAKEVWTRVRMLLHQRPVHVELVVAAAPWDDLEEEVRAAILACADRSLGCAAVAIARGRRDAATVNITEWGSAEFFGALDPDVWGAMDADVQRRWRMALKPDDRHLAIRSLGPQPEILAWTSFDDNLVRAVKRSVRDAAALRAALFPVAVRSLSFDAMHDLIAALPPPPDPGVFFFIVGKHDDPSVIDRARTILHAPSDLACAIALQRIWDNDRPQDACPVLQDALCGRTWDDLAPILDLLSGSSRFYTTPDRDSLDFLAQRLASPNQRALLRQTLDRLMSLPPEIAIPTNVALRRIGGDVQPYDDATVITSTLHAHGDVFLTIADALEEKTLRNVLLPLPKDAATADALRAMARDDPPTARQLAYAMYVERWKDALHALLTAAPPHAGAVWRALSKDAQRAIGAVVAAASPDADPLAVFDPIAALALAAAQSDDPALRDASVAALASRPEIVRTMWRMLPSEVQQDLCTHVAVADLLMPHPHPSAARRERRRR